MKRITVTIDDKHYEKLTKNKEQGMPISVIVRKALSSWYFPNSKKEKKA